MITLDAILHQSINAHAWVAGVYDCNSFAGRNYQAALDAGYDPKTVRVAVVIDEKHELHMIAEVGDTVLDQRFTWTMSKKMLKDYGYTWVWEGKPEDDPVPQDKPWHQRMMAQIRAFPE
jgi:hypothetical protein